MTAKPIIIKKYPNRRLYRTDESKYITLEDLKKLVKEHREFLVQDAKTGADLTQSTLVQIIFEQEADGGGMLPANFLKHLILFYDDNLKNVLPSYLESSMDAFHKNQEDIRSFMQKQFGNQSPTMFQFPLNMQEMQKRNLEYFDNYMKMLSQMNPMLGYFNKDTKK